MSAAIAAVVGSVAVGAYGASQAKKAANKASKQQIAADDKAIEEQRRQFDEIQKLLAPYVAGGNEATTAQRAFLGLAGADAERAAIEAVRNSEAFQTGAREGENAILQNAAATGGLRGGNTQAALAKFRPNLLNQLIAQRFAGLDLLANRGQASAAGQAAAGQNTAAAISGLLQDQGAAQAGAALARGNANAGFANSLVQAGGTLAGYALGKPRNPNGVISPGAQAFYSSIDASNASKVPSYSGPR